MSEIGRIKPITREINLNSDRKRFWSRELESLEGKSHSDSIPINAVMVANIISRERTSRCANDNEAVYKPESDT
ncbi:MAG: hypothetical protein ACRD5H_03100 [Nitrososphaerales archaeon]